MINKGLARTPNRTFTCSAWRLAMQKVGWVYSFSNGLARTPNRTRERQTEPRDTKPNEAMPN